MSRTGAPASPDEPVQPAGKRGGGGGGALGRVLVVEDDAALAALLEATLADLGHQVAVAHDEAAALRVVAAGRPACILLDLHLPVMDGAAFLAAYRAQAQDQSGGGAVREVVGGISPAPVILLTGLSNDEAAGHATRLGVAGFLTKPYDLDA